MFPGDPDFTLDKYPHLPYEYVILAYFQGGKQQSKALHMQERPVAMITAMMANQNRDPKKRTTPYSMEDFYLYQPKELKDLPAARYGSAAMSLLKDGLFPTWALFCYKELAAAGDAPVPALRAFIGEDFLVLAPKEVDGHIRGLLIAQESAGSGTRSAMSPEGDRIWLDVPEIKTKVIAEEDVSLRIARRG